MGMGNLTTPSAAWHVGITAVLPNIPSMDIHHTTGTQSQINLKVNFNPSQGVEILPSSSTDQWYSPKRDMFINIQLIFLKKEFCFSFKGLRF